MSRLSTTLGVVALALLIPAFSSQDALARGARSGAQPATGRGSSPARPPASGPMRPDRSVGPRGVQGPPEVTLRGERALRAVEILRMRRLMQEIRATEAQRERIRKAYSAGLSKRHQLLRDRARILTMMRELVGPRDAAGAVSREREMQKLVLRYRQVDRELAETAWATDDKIFKNLSPADGARYILFNERFDTELRERIGALKQRGRGLGATVPPVDIPE